jgi:hypothetical protein
MADLISMLAAAAGTSAGGGDYQISRSLRFNSADSAYLSRTPASAGNRKTWTWSGWVKRTGTVSPSNATIPLFGVTAGQNDANYLSIGAYQDSIRIISWNTAFRITTAVFRDYSAWQHIVVAFDTTQSTAADRIKLYVNGVQVTAFSTSTDPTLDTDYPINNNVAHNIFSDIGSEGSGSANYLSGYLTEVNFIDGQALTPSSFGETNETTGVWSPIRYAGSYGTNGFYLNFSDNSDVTATTLGKDQAGSNNWTPSGSPGFSVTAGAGNDSLVDTPTPYGTDTGAGGEVRGNYATWNPLDQVQSSTFSNGNLDVVTGTTTVFGARGTIAVSSGQWYWEVTPTAGVATADCIIGIDSSITPINSSTAQKNVGATATSYGYRASGEKITSSSSTAYGNSYTNNDVIGVALNLDAGEIKFYKNGVVQNSGTAAFTGLSGSFYPAFSDGDPSNALTVTANFGQRPFAYTAPSGFKALVTTNLPEPTVVQGDNYFNTVLYTGNGGTTNVTGVGFQPDWVWYKCRSDAFSNRVFDVVRGVSKGLITNSTAVEEDPLNGVTSFDADGFTVGSDSGGNFNGSTFVAWNWKADGAGVSNTAGSITSTVSANTIAGISIVTYTGNATQGATVGHGLGVTPSMLIVKSRSLATDWVVQHSSAGTAPSKLILNSTAAVTNSAPEWNNAGGTPTAFNSTVFTIAGSGYSVNNSGATYVAYCFAEVEGFSKFGSFTGNDSADGPFIFTGFRPAFFLYKKSSSTSDWWMFDAARNTYNVVSAYLFPNLSNTEGTENWFDFTANGLKMRDRTDLNTNHSGSTYIYMAFAENPFKYSLAR